MRPLGRTGLLVSEFALGTWGLSGDGYAGGFGATDDEAERVVARAVDVGITLVDTADAYGGGRAEAMLGRALAAHPEVFVVTKGGTDRSTEPAQKRMDAGYLRVAVDRSRKRLARERLDVYLLHNPSPDALRKGEATGTLAALKKEGALGHWGVSVGDVDTARAAIEQGAEVIELAYNLFQSGDLHRISGDVLVDKVGVLARSPLAYGLLAGEWPRGKEFPEDDHRAGRWTRAELERRMEQLDALRFLVRGDVRTLRAAAVRYVLSNPLVSTVVLGPRSTRAGSRARSARRPRAACGRRRAP
ncbi:aldo/keto reductase, partial [bacterium]